ncbi:MAG TPA: hypothetical protein VEC36_13120 [Patescibacteria group bacterium]|nr:hypothetical protein [Patescibacteria group bacterium]
MAINPVNRNNAAQNISGTQAKRQAPAAQDSTPVKRGDSLELSAEVRALRESGDVNRIQTKIANGFYNRPDIIGRTAEKLLQDLDSGTES